ncbi:MAG: glutamine amidotransferase [Rhodospirillaceae bacterium]|nr:glutamine amidotransferase [Rhodospirillaceae bacterium]|tara:strand:- start:16310 stop:17020 length:711 start_codon:yes stop_codon:yes gene_type:complete
MTKTVIAVRHVEFEHLGSFAAILEDRGYTVRYVDAGINTISTSHSDDADLLVVLGGPIGAYEDDRYPYLTDELALIQRHLAAKRPILGICLGAQLIARALGSKVYPGSKKEIGWSQLNINNQIDGNLLEYLTLNNNQVLHWHGDTFDLPDHASCLASTDVTPNQTFIVGDTVLGLQFHIEVLSGEIERWLIGHASEIAATDGVTVEKIRSDTSKYGPALEKAARTIFSDWLDRAGL